MKNTYAHEGQAVSARSPPSRLRYGASRRDVAAFKKLLLRVRLRHRLLGAVVGVRPRENEDGEHGEERLHADEGGGHVVVDLGLDRAGGGVVLGVLPLREGAVGILGVDHDGVFGGGDVHGELHRDRAGAVGGGGRGALLQDLEHVGGLPALLVLLEVVDVLAPRALLDLLVGEAELDVDSLADGETGVRDVDEAGAGGVLGRASVFGANLDRTQVGDGAVAGVDGGVRAGEGEREDGDSAEGTHGV
mmetsp:Transcript_156796/g.380841  ORF Transcript_156796/g.380841 Transcript_156796/m.380841 type:complete len:247 (+) Transcript_156796:44-784(+)